ncbi:hypothetical protein S7335_1307 [Synechococcus sp. PCC 7335]|uniref:hypothetical protein n=1 Tax=Synechococcus sp. (strain ATCC 29403 / PCC 7335) TaxID=91464 RepID=UPI00017EB1C6|nr:hypothetical protein [Synechococcus sp. PCC 7335]EDX82603.1 hypothetical protein S7335_1307 [Synechococcus sp. PCC 7335]
MMIQYPDNFYKLLPEDCSYLFTEDYDLHSHGGSCVVAVGWNSTLLSFFAFVARCDWSDKFDPLLLRLEEGEKKYHEAGEFIEALYDSFCDMEVEDFSLPEWFENDLRNGTFYDRVFTKTVMFGLGANAF